MKDQSYSLVEELLFQVKCAGFVHLIGDFRNNDSDTFASKVNCKDACATHIRKLLPPGFWNEDDKFPEFLISEHGGTHAIFVNNAFERFLGISVLSLPSICDKNPKFFCK